MKKYDFETLLERKGHDALAIDALGLPGFPGYIQTSLEENEQGKKYEHAAGKGEAKAVLSTEKYPIWGDYKPIPMWVADMNFIAFEGMISAIKERLNHPSLGYYLTRDEYYEAIIKWHEREYGIEGLKKEHLMYHNSVLGGIVSALMCFTVPGEEILIHSPTYTGFTHAIEDAGRRLLKSELIQDQDGVWKMNYEAMEQKIKEHHIHVVLLNTPHNPTGRIFTQEELKKAYDIFKRYDCVVLSDEIWADLRQVNLCHIPASQVNEDAKQRTISFYSIGKSFSAAALTSAYSVIYNKTLQNQLMKQASLTHYNKQNVLSMYALIGAYSDEGSNYLRQLRAVLDQNLRLLADFFNTIPGVKAYQPEGTYMFFPDFKDYLLDQKMTQQDLVEAFWKMGVMGYSAAPFFHQTAMRLNAALPTAFIEEVILRLKKGVFAD